MREFEFINRVKKLVLPHNNPVIRSIGDDCAIIPYDAAYDMLITSDSLYEGVHFTKKNYKPWEIGARAMSVNISDICAMGGIPLYALVSIGFSKKEKQPFIDSLYRGILDYAQNYSMDLIGGDTISAPGLFLTVTVIGKVEKGRALRRDGAKPGDTVFTTGFLGDSHAGLKVISKKGRSRIKNYEHMPVNKHILPIPSYMEGRLLLESGCVGGCMDLSDGIISDIARICGESGTGAVIDADSLPISYPAQLIARQYKDDPVDYALYGGEDFELLFTVAGSKMAKFEKFCAENTFVAFRVGRITASKKIQVKRDGKLLTENFKKVWNHF